ncbi:MAG: hypothetical protein RQ753_06720 [Desulfurivibrionaceae bacterium]|nr:hypothetical protein [Desulfurivibrionaceae bacterium]
MAHAVHAPGALLIQIDGLGYDRLLAAIDKNRLPFLQRMIQREHFVLRKFYSGLPSATPAVQAELFFGSEPRCRPSNTSTAAPAGKK